MSPKSFGEELRQLRETVGLSLDDIILETKISRRILEALEDGRFQFLPERVFTRNFVRQYARMIQTDEEQLLESFEAAWERFLVASGSHQYELVTEMPKRVIRWYFWVPISVTVAIFLAISVVILRGPKRQSDVSFEPRRPSDAWTTPVSRPTDVPQTSDQQQNTGNSNSEAEEGILRLRLAVLEEKECWVKYRDLEGKTGEGLLKDGDTLNLELVGPVWLKVGNAGAVALRIGETECEPLGQGVVTVEVTRDGVVHLGSGER